jgi:hypothetical protein
LKSFKNSGVNLKVSPSGFKGRDSRELFLIVCN